MEYQPSGPHRRGGRATDGHRGRPLARDERLELVPELLQPADDRCGARVAEHADRLAGHVLRQVEQRVEVLERALTGDDALEDLRGPRRALAALRALRAALVRVEAREAGDHARHALGVVEDDDAAGAEHRALRDEPFVIHQRGFGLVHRLDRHRATTRDHGLELTASAHAARTRFLKNEGYDVIRFANADVMGNLEGVMTAIAAVVATKQKGCP